MDANGEPICNEFDCPLLTMSHLVYCVPSECIKHAISVIHECTDSCTFITRLTSKVVKHESVSASDLSYAHDWSHNLYCHNIYCMLC